VTVEEDESVYDEDNNSVVYILNQTAMALNNQGVGAEGLMAAASTLAMPGEEFGNDERVEALWAIKAMEHAEVYFNLLCSVDPKMLKLSKNDDEIYAEFRKVFPDMPIAKLDEQNHLKSPAMKEKWRSFCNGFKHVEDFSFGCLLRLDSQGEYSEENSSLVSKIQFYAVEVARNREGLNDVIKTKFKPTPRKKKPAGQQTIDSGIADKLPGNLGKEVEHELQQIIAGQHALLK